jgi:ribonuclease BN (tRNA processing enzyme)
MKIQVLGASGGIGGPARTTSLRVDHDILIDAGSGAADLELSDLVAIDHVFLTHSHLDHVLSLPLLLDSVGADRTQPVIVHAQRLTLDVLQAHVFNNKLWPDFSRIPTPENPFVRFQELPVGGTFELGGRRIRSIPVNHVVPAVGYLISASDGSFAYSGDTTTTDEFWSVLNACPDLKHVVVETTFLDEDEELCRLARHLCPSLLAKELAKLKAQAEVHITHLMPGKEDDIMAEIARHLPGREIKRLLRGETIKI